MLPTLTFETRIRCTPEELWDFHSDVNALKLLTPAGTSVSILSEDTEVREGALHVLRVRKMGLPLVWKARIRDVHPPHEFSDWAERSPFKSWLHHHEFLAEGDGSVLKDTVTYELSFGFLGAIANRLFVQRDIEAMFTHRHAVTKKSLE